MKKVFSQLTLIAISCFFVSAVYAQHEFDLGIQGGLSIPNLKAGSDNQNPLANGYSSRLGADFGILATYHVKGKFSLQADIDYSEQGGKHDGMQAITNPYSQGPIFLYANFDNSAHLNYLLIPVMARFDFTLSDKWQFYAEAGGFAGFLLSAKSVSSGNSPLYADSLGTEQVAPSQSFDTTTSIKSSINSFNAGVIGAVGLSYKVGDGKLFLEGGGNYGFINIQKYAEDGTNYSGAATIRIGYLCSLKCKKKH
jgi:hypothetical protein